MQYSRGIYSIREEYTVFKKNIQRSQKIYRFYEERNEKNYAYKKGARIRHN